jgi:methylenetetrahydrofolate reductase (NADPH)
MITEIDKPTTGQATALQERIQSGRPLLLAEISPPLGSDPATIRQAARALAGKVHAVGVTDNRDRVAMSALAASSLVAAEGVEPVLHVTTRDRNRIALISECLGAQALGIRNLLCTSGGHQTLGPYRAARNVYDIDAIQLLGTYAALDSRATLVGEERIAGVGPFCLGAVAAPYADPLEMQMLRLAKKIQAGAQFLITEPVYDLERFAAWWTAVVRRGLNEQAAFLAGIRPLAETREAELLAQSRPAPRIPEGLCQRLAAADGAAAQRAAGIQIARETVQRLAALEGLRGFAVGASDVTLVLETLEKSSLRV